MSDKSLYDRPVAAVNPLPIFESNQVLLAEHLNGLGAYSDQAVRATRLYTLGVGILDGLEAFYRDEELTVTHGAAITTHGHLITRGSTERFTHAIKYETARSDNAEPPDGWAAHMEDIWLLTNDAHWEGAVPLTEIALDGAGIVIMLERVDHDINPCEAVENCRDQGRRLEWSARPLLVTHFDDHADALGLEHADALAALPPVVVENPTLVAGVDPQALRDDPEGALRQYYRTATAAALEALKIGIIGLDRVVDRFELPPADGNPSERLDLLRRRLAPERGDALDLNGVLSTYRFAIHLARLYSALSSFTMRLEAAFRPHDDLFPLHVSLGRLSPHREPRGREVVEARHTFRPAGRWGEAAAARRAWSRLRDKLVERIDQFNPDDSPDRIIPRAHPDGFEVLAHEQGWVPALTRPWSHEPQADHQIDPPDARLNTKVRDLYLDGLRGRSVTDIKRTLIRYPVEIEVIDLDRPMYALPPYQAADYRMARRIVAHAAHQLLLLIQRLPELPDHTARDQHHEFAEYLDLPENYLTAFRSFVTAVPSEPHEPSEALTQLVIDRWVDVLDIAARAAWLVPRIGALFGAATGHYPAYFAGSLAELRRHVADVFAADVQPVIDALSIEGREPGLVGYILRNPSVTYRPSVPIGGTLVLLTRKNDMEQDIVVAELAHPGTPRAAVEARGPALYAVYSDVPVDEKSLLFDPTIVPGLQTLGPAAWELGGEAQETPNLAQISMALHVELNEVLDKFAIRERDREPFLRPIVGPKARPTRAGSTPFEKWWVDRPIPHDLPYLDNMGAVRTTPAEADLRYWKRNIDTDDGSVAQLHLWVASRHRDLFVKDHWMHTVRRSGADNEPSRTVGLYLNTLVTGAGDVDYQIIEHPTRGALVLDGTYVTYTPNTDQVGVDVFSWGVSRAGADDATAPVRANIFVYIADCCEREEPLEAPQVPAPIRLAAGDFMHYDRSDYPVRTTGDVIEVFGEGIRRSGFSPQRDWAHRPLGVAFAAPGKRELHLRGFASWQFNPSRVDVPEDAMFRDIALGYIVSNGRRHLNALMVRVWREPTVELQADYNHGRLQLSATIPLGHDAEALGDVFDWHVEVERRWGVRQALELNSNSSVSIVDIRELTERLEAELGDWMSADSARLRDSIAGGLVSPGSMFTQVIFRVSVRIAELPHARPIDATRAYNMLGALQLGRNDTWGHAWELLEGAHRLLPDDVRDRIRQEVERLRLLEAAGGELEGADSAREVLIELDALVNERPGRIPNAVSALYTSVFGALLADYHRAGQLPAAEDLSHWTGLARRAGVRAADVQRLEDRMEAMGADPSLRAVARALAPNREQ